MLLYIALPVKSFSFSFSNPCDGGHLNSADIWWKVKRLNFLDILHVDIEIQKITFTC